MKIKINDSYLIIKKNPKNNYLITLIVGIEDNHNNKEIKLLNKQQVMSLINELKKLSNEMTFTDNVIKTCSVYTNNCPQMLNQENKHICLATFDCEAQKIE